MRDAIRKIISLNLTIAMVLSLLVTGTPKAMAADYTGEDGLVIDGVSYDPLQDHEGNNWTWETKTHVWGSDNTKTVYGTLTLEEYHGNNIKLPSENVVEYISVHLCDSTVGTADVNIPTIMCDGNLSVGGSGSNSAVNGDIVASDISVYIQPTSHLTINGSLLANEVDVTVYGTPGGILINGSIDANKVSLDGEGTIHVVGDTQTIVCERLYILGFIILESAPGTPVISPRNDMLWIYNTDYGRNGGLMVYDSIDGTPMSQTSYYLHEPFTTSSYVRTEPIPHTTTLDANGGMINGKSSLAYEFWPDIQISPEEYIIERPGYFFLGWKVGTGDYIWIEPVGDTLSEYSSNSVATAQWVKKTYPRSALFYYPNYQTKPKDDYHQVVDADNVVALQVPADEDVRNYVGWIEQDPNYGHCEEITPFMTPGTMAALAPDTVLYPYATTYREPYNGPVTTSFWTELIFDGNGGTTPMPAKNSNPVPVEHSVFNGSISAVDLTTYEYELDLSEANFTKPYATLQEWNTERDGSGKSYAPDGIYDFMSEPMQETLYAQWNASREVIAVTGLTAIDRKFDGTTNVAITGGALQGVLNDDDVRITTPIEGIVAEMNVGNDKTVAISDITLCGDDADKYALEKPSNITVNITKADAPAVETITSNAYYEATEYTTPVTISGLPDDRGTTTFTVGAVTGDPIIDGIPTVTETGIEYRATGGTVGQTATIPVTVTMQNYADAIVNVVVTLVEKIPITITGVAVADKTYDNTSFVYTATPANEQGYDGIYEYIWSTPDNQVPKDAGTYTFTVKVPDSNEDYMGELVLNDLLIAPKALTVKPKNIAMYNSEALPTAFELEFNGLIDGETITATGEAPTYEIRTQGETPTVVSRVKNGTYDIVWTNKDAVVMDNDNYAITKEDATLTITSRPSSGGGYTPTPKPQKPLIEENEDGTTTIATEALEALIDGVGNELIVSSDVGTITLDTAALAEILGEAEKEITISIAKADKNDLNEKQQQAVGDAMLLDLSIKSGKTVISDFGDGNATITIPYTLKEGEQAEGIVVYYVDDMGNISDVNAVYDEENREIRFTTDHFSIYMISYDSFKVVNPFTDVCNTDWFYTGVGYAFENKLMSGTSATSFEPNTATTRGMIWTVLARMAGEDTTGGELWYTKGMDWAVAQGVSDGTNPKDSITRQELATMLYRYSDQPATSSDLAAFDDATAVAHWATDAMTWAVEQGIVSGTTTTTLAPTSTASRAEVATMLMRFGELKK